MVRVDEEDVTTSGLYQEQTHNDALHDLSSWRVTVPRTGARPDLDNIRKQYYVFIIDVRRVDVQEGVILLNFLKNTCSCTGY